MCVLLRTNNCLIFCKFNLLRVFSSKQFFFHLKDCYPLTRTIDTPNTFLLFDYNCLKMSNPNVNMGDWNFMEDVYKDPKLNSYDSGPGAALDSSLQPGELAKNFTNLNVGESAPKISPFLVLKTIPKGMSLNAIKNLCEQFGNTLSCTQKPTCPYVFVNFTNIADLEAVHRGLNKSDFGFQVSLGQKNKSTEKKEYQLDNGFNIPRVPSPNSEPSYDNSRTIAVFDKKPPRPKFSQLCDANANDFKQNLFTLPLNDPFRCALKEGDAHAVERAGAETSDDILKAKGTCQYRTGRAFQIMPEEIKKYFKENHEKSDGIYDPEKEVFEKNRRNGASKIKINMCIKCKVRQADLLCYRCIPEVKTFYCSRKCQTDDWEEHKKYCGSRRNCLLSQKPNCNSAPKLPSSSSPISFRSESSKVFPIPSMPPPDSKVALTAVGKADLVFIRSTALESDVQYLKIISKLQSAVKELEPLTNIPVCGEAVIAKFKNDEYGRALVLNAADSENIKVNFLDYGNTDFQTFSNLFKSPKDFVELPRFAVPVKLKNVPNCVMTDKVRTLLYFYLNNMDLIVKYDATNDLLPETNIYEVDLYETATNEHLNKKVAALCKPEEPKSGDDIIMMEDIPFVDLPVGENVVLYIMDNSHLQIGCISCTTKEFALEIEKFSDEIQRYANSLEAQNYTPRSNELCIAKYDEDDLWYRGRCLERIGDGCPTIHFVDYGNTNLVPIKNIRPYPPKFTWPIYTADYFIEGLPKEIDQASVKKLEELLPCGQRLNCDFIEKDSGNFYFLTLKNVVNLLK